MKKIFVLLLSTVLVLGLCGCGGNAQEEQVITRSTEGTTAPAEAVTEAPVEAARAEFADFQFDGKALTVGAELDLSALPKADSVYQVPSCAIEGTDNVYRYDSFEITAYDDGDCELIYSIYFVTPDAQTPEGLSLGESLDRVLELYGGENYEQVGTAYIYDRADARLIILVQNDVVISIEYRMITE